MSEWDFLWGLTGEELIDAMAQGYSIKELPFIDEQKSYSQTRAKNKKNEKNNMQKKEGQHLKKRNMAIFIDGENISYKKADKIMKISNSLGILYEAKVYARQKDLCTRRWSDMAKKHGITDIRLFGGSEKNKVDRKIKKDAKKEILRHKNIDIVCLVTSDLDYIDTISFLRSQGKQVVVLGEKKASASLRRSCNKFFEI